MNIVKYAPKTYVDRFFDTGRFLHDYMAWAPAGWRQGLGEDQKFKIVVKEKSDNQSAEVPGMKEKDIDLEIKDGLITLKGHTEESQEKEENHYRMREFSRRSFERSFRIGEGVDPDKISAKLGNGVLTVALPKKEEAKPKTVKVEIGS
jgi:HSP20 family protein